MILKLLLALAFVLTFLGCSNKDENSPLITISRPFKNQVILHRDSLVIEAGIKPVNGHISEYRIIILNKKGLSVYEKQLSCDCADLHFVRASQSFIYENTAASPTANSEFTLEICAFLTNGEQICKRVPFKMS